MSEMSWYFCITAHSINKTSPVNKRSLMQDSGTIRGNKLNSTVEHIKGFM